MRWLEKDYQETLIIQIIYTYIYICVCVCVCVCVCGEINLIFRQKISIFVQNLARAAVIFTNAFLRQSDSSFMKSLFKNSSEMVDDKIWIASQILKDQNSTQFKKCFPP